METTGSELHPGPQAGTDAPISHLITRIVFAFPGTGRETPPTIGPWLTGLCSYCASFLPIWAPPCSIPVLPPCLGSPCSIPVAAHMLRGRSLSMGLRCLYLCCPYTLEPPFPAGYPSSLSLSSTPWRHCGALVIAFGNSVTSGNW